MATVTVGDNDYPSFADQEFADQYLAGDVLRALPWSVKNEDAKGRGLTSATRAMLGLPWTGTAPDPDSAEQIPVVLQVCAMYASDLLAKPKLFADAAGNSNVKTVKAGSASVEFFRPVTGQPPFPMQLWLMLLRAGLVGTTGAGDEEAGAIVSGICAGDRPIGGRYGDYTRLGYGPEDCD